MSDGPTDHDNGGPSYCPNCGNALQPPGIYCSQCGTKVGTTAPAREDGTAGQQSTEAGRESRGSARGRPREESQTARGNQTAAPRKSPADEEETYDQFRQRVRTWLSGDWEIERDYGDSVAVVDRDYGSFWIHALVFITTVWFTGGIGNVLYAVYAHETGGERVVLERGEEASTPAEYTAEGDDGTTARLLGGLALIVVGFALAVTNLLDPSMIGVGLFVALTGTLLFPPTRRRIEDRHPVTKNGRVRTTDETVVEDPSTPCSVCGSHIDRGVRREYTEEVALAGVPLYTAEEGANYYCETHAAPGATGPAGTGTGAVDIEEELAATRAAAENDGDAAAGNADVDYGDSGTGDATTETDRTTETTDDPDVEYNEEYGVEFED
jgi:hypothetical protein